MLTVQSAKCLGRVIQLSILLRLTQQPCVGVKRKWTQIVLNRLILSGVKVAAVSSLVNVEMLIAKFALSLGPMIHHISTQRARILTQCADASKKDNQRLTTSTAMAVAA